MTVTITPYVCPFCTHNAASLLSEQQNLRTYHKFSHPVGFVSYLQLQDETARLTLGTDWTWRRNAVDWQCAPLWATCLWGDRLYLIQRFYTCLRAAWLQIQHK
jgi:hypothetical protein